MVCCATLNSALASTNEARLSETQRALQESQEKATELSHKMEEVNAELSKLEKEKDTLVATIRDQQEQVTANRAEISTLEQQKADKEKDLHARREEIAQLLHGMIRLQRMPRHYIAAQPGDAQNLLRTASALDISYGATHRRFNEVQTEFAELAALGTQLKASEAALSKKLKTVQTQQAKLSKTLGERRKIQLSLRNDHDKVQKRVHELSRESENLQQLISKLESETLLFKDLGPPGSKPSVPAAPSMAIASRKGTLPYPAPGRLLHKYGEKRGRDDRFRGVEILTESGAPVTAPHAGKIMFSGEFMDYGPMVIIDHDNGYHSVIAGLDVVEVQPGDSISAEGLVGVMGQNEQARTLYFELRKDSKPIDPAGWMGNLRTIASR